MQSFQPGGNLLYEAVGVIVVLIIGFFLIMKAGNKFGWLVVAVACVYGYLAIKPQLGRVGESAGTPPANPGASSGYYKVP